MVILKNAKRRHLNLKVGDVFRVLCTEMSVEGAGQILAKKHSSYYVGIFDKVVPIGQANVEEFLDAPWLVVAWTVDALFFHGDWLVVENSVPRVERIPASSFVVQAHGAWHVTDFMGQVQRPALPNEVVTLRQPFSLAPIALHNAFCRKAATGEIDSDSDLNYWRLAKSN